MLICSLQIAKADDVTKLGLQICNAAYNSCEKQRADSLDLFHTEKQTTAALNNRLAQADEKLSQQASATPSYVWALGGSAVTVVALALLGMLKGRN